MYIAFLLGIRQKRQQLYSMAVSPAICCNYRQHQVICFLEGLRIVGQNAARKPQGSGLVERHLFGYITPHWMSRAENIIGQNRRRYLRDFSFDQM